MSDFLAAVIAERRADADRARPGIGALRAAAARAPRPRSLRDALGAARGAGRLGVIAEVKRVSPALGRLAEIPDPAALARAYAAAGAAAISVLTEPRHWGGSLDDLRAVRGAVDVPVLCKDIVVDEVQLIEARAAGADAVLLVAEALDDERCAALLEASARLGLDVLLEAHERSAFARAVASGAALLGVNARDLRRPAALERVRFAELAPLAGPERLLVAESGIGSADDARALPGRFDAVLVGTALVRSAHPEELVASLAAIVRPAVAAR